MRNLFIFYICFISVVEWKEERLMQEIVDRIKAAEKSAEDQKAAAVKAADKIVSDAKAAGRKHVDDVIAAASEEAGKITAKAEADSSTQAAEKIVVVKKEAEKILKGAGSGFDAAIEKVVERVVSDI